MARRRLRRITPVVGRTACCGRAVPGVKDPSMPAPRPAALLAAAVLALAPGAARAGAGATPEVRALVKKVVAAYGGPAAMAKLARVRQEGTVSSTVLHPGPPGRLLRMAERPGKLRVEIQYPEKPVEVRVLAAGRGWRGGVEVQGPMLAAMVLQAARLQLPALLAAAGDEVADGGTLEHDGVALRVLSLEVTPGVVVQAAVDPGSGRILRSRGTAAGPVPLEFITVSSDFRTVDGVLVPFREGNYANGRSTGDTALEKVSFPSALPPGAFEL